jgi:membrane associated rhomboid family serine protease
MKSLSWDLGGAWVNLCAKILHRRLPCRTVMIPLRDDQPSFGTPAVTYFLVAFNILIFLFETTLSPGGLHDLFRQFALTPEHVARGLAGYDGGVPGALFPLLTSMFLHGGWMHLLGNMWVLWIFGDNIEDQLGHFPYLIFYLACGIGAAVLHVLLNWGSPVPTVGASGAIAGVMGAFLLLYPRARVSTFLPPFFFFPLPAWVVLGYWIVAQFFSGAAQSLLNTRNGGGGGIAFWAHVGGFLVGMLLIKALPERKGRYRYGTW